MAERILTRTERMRARLATGALAHFAAGFADWVTFLVRHARSRHRGAPRA